MEYRDYGDISVFKEKFGQATSEERALSGFRWNMKPLEELTKEELTEALKWTLLREEKNYNDHNKHALIGQAVEQIARLTRI